MSNLVYLANGDIVNMNIEKFTNTPEVDKLNETLQEAQRLEIEMKTSIQNVNEAADNFMLSLSRK